MGGMEWGEGAVGRGKGAGEERGLRADKVRKRATGEGRGVASSADVVVGARWA